MSRRPLWAPWRLDYIMAPKDGACIFCEAASAEVDEANLVLERGSVCFTMLNAFPYAPGHLMVVPFRHIDCFGELTSEESIELMALTKRALAALSEAMTPGGFNIGLNLGAVAGAGIIDHLHLHIVPRWQGDNNFMPVLSGTHVMPQALDAARAILAAALRRQSSA